MCVSVSVKGSKQHFWRFDDGVLAKTVLVGADVPVNADMFQVRTYYLDAKRPRKRERLRADGA